MSVEARGAALWVLRMAMQWGGVYLAGHGIGDEAFWGEIADVGAGALIAVAGAVWSYRARKAQIAAPPPEPRA